MNHLYEFEQWVTLNEIGDSSAPAYKFKLVRNDRLRKEYEFTTDSGLLYGVWMRQDWVPPSETWTIAYSTREDGKKNKPEYPVLNKGEQYRILATVMNVLEDFMKRKPKVVGYVFDATSEEGEDPKVPNRRLRLYQAFFLKRWPQGQIVPMNAENAKMGFGNINDGILFIPDMAKFKAAK